MCMYVCRRRSISDIDNSSMYMHDSIIARDGGSHRSELPSRLEDNKSYELLSVNHPGTNVSISQHFPFRKKLYSERNVHNDRNREEEKERGHNVLLSHPVFNYRNMYNTRRNKRDLEEGEIVEIVREQRKSNEQIMLDHSENEDMDDSRAVFALGGVQHN